MEFAIVIVVVGWLIFALVRSIRKPRSLTENAHAQAAESATPTEAPETVLPAMLAESSAEVPVPQAPPTIPTVSVQRQPDPPVRATRPRRNHIEYGTVAHFPDLPTKTARCVGMGHYLSDSQRGRLNPGFVLAIPEPKNKHDANAIAIADPAGRKLGYLSAGQAKSYAPLIQALGALQLDCRRDGSKLWVDLPNLPALRKRVAGLS